MLTSAVYWDGDGNIGFWMDEWERGAKRKVRFHVAGEERDKKQKLKGAAYVPVPAHIRDRRTLWAWVKETRPRVTDFLAADGWRQVGHDGTSHDLLPGEFDYHFREGLEAQTRREKPWMQQLISRIDCWGAVTLKAENAIPQLPWPFLPVGKSGASGARLRVLDLGDNETVLSIWGKKGTGVKIFERQCYKELWEVKIEPLFKQQRRVAVLVLGTPGIGKTGFLFYVLVLLLKAQKKVLFRAKSASLYYFDCDQGGKYSSYEVGSCDEVNLDSDRDIYFLADGSLQQVPVFVGKALLTSSPLLSNYKEYQKDGACTTFFLPVWWSYEVALLRQELFPGTSLKDTESRYLEWGGNPRHVLEITSENLHVTIQNIEALQNVVSAVASGGAESSHPSHKVLHMRILDDHYKEYDLQYSSPFARRAVYRKLQQDHAYTLRAFVAFKGIVMQGFGSLKDGMLQEHFWQIAVQTKQFRVREMFEDVISTTVSAPKIQTFIFGQPLKIWSLDDLPSMVYDTIIWPDNPVEESIEALRITKNAAGKDVLQGFQVTVSSERHRHGLKYNGILERMRRFNVPAKQVEIYIVTTNELFNDAGWQNWRTKDNKVLRDMNIKQKLKGVRQFALDSNA